MIRRSLRRLRCFVLGHAIRDTGNRWGDTPITRCTRCRRVWFGTEEMFGVRRGEEYNPWT